MVLLVSKRGPDIAGFRDCKGLLKGVVGELVQQNVAPLI
jgi:hypothetical protein